MKEIEKREDESDLALIEEDEFYDNEDLDKTLEDNCLRQSIRESFIENKSLNNRFTQVLKRRN